jgi:uncharacterized membrane protein YedE/YeeE
MFNLIAVSCKRVSAYILLNFHRRYFSAGYLVGGFLVGIGTRLGNGCTTG